MAAWEGPQLLLANVKNASGRIGIFWFRFKNWLTTKTNNRIDFNISKTDLILGRPNCKSRLVNLVYLVAKQYIYSCRCRGTFPRLIGCISRLKEIRDSELYNAKYGTKYDECKAFWDWLET